MIQLPFAGNILTLNPDAELAILIVSGFYSVISCELWQQ
jgi:hypothetical protein